MTKRFLTVVAVAAGLAGCSGRGHVAARCGTVPNLDWKADVVVHLDKVSEDARVGRVSLPYEVAMRTGQTLLVEGANECDRHFGRPEVQPPNPALLAPLQYREVTPGMAGVSATLFKANGAGTSRLIATGSEDVCPPPGKPDALCTASHPALQLLVTVR